MRSRDHVQPPLMLSGMRLRSVLLLTAAGALAACGGDAPSEQLGRADWGDEWPLTVDSGTVRCEDGGLVLFEADGTTYAVNGTAMSQRPELPEVDEIWADNPDIPGAKIDIGPVLDSGLELCE